MSLFIIYDTNIILHRNYELANAHLEISPYAYAS